LTTTEEQNARLREENAELGARLTDLEAALQLQKDLVAELFKRIYGPGSEKIDPAQLLLKLLGGEDVKKPEAAGEQDPEPAADPKASKQKSPKKRRSQKLRNSMRALPTVTLEIIPEEVLANPDGYRRIGEEISERLEVSPAAFTRHITVRPTYVERSQPESEPATAPVTAPLPPPILEGSVLTPSLGAYLLTEKFCYHQPFYRQEWRFKHAHGIDLSRGLMCHWHNHLADQLLPLYDLTAAKMRASDYIKVDETPIAYLDPGTGKTSTGQFWVYHHVEHGVLFDWHTSRANTCLDHILGGPDDDDAFEGYLHSDGLRAYRTYIRRRPKNVIIPVSCLTHIRRKFINAVGDHPRITAWILHIIGKIYALEAALRQRGASHAVRQRARRMITRRHYDHLIKLIAHLLGRRTITPASALGKALRYAHDQLPHLAPCFEDGQIEFDNNLTENAIRPTKLGMKNWMFVGGADTGWRSAVIYTFVEQVRRLGGDPYAYFEWVFGKLPSMTNQDDFEPLLPCSWFAELPKAAPATDQAAA